MKELDQIKNLKYSLENKLEKLLDYNTRQMYISTINALDWIINDQYSEFIVSKNHESITDSIYSFFKVSTKNYKDDVEELEKKLLFEELKEKKILNLLEDFEKNIKNDMLYIRKDDLIITISKIRNILKGEKYE